MADDLRGSIGVVLGRIFLKYLSPTPSRHAEPRMLAEWGEDAAENIFLGGARGPVDASEGPSKQSTVGLTVDTALAAIERHNRGLFGRASPRLRPPRPRQLARKLAQLGVERAERTARQRRVGNDQHGRGTGAG